MIRDVADMLAALSRAEAAKLAEEDITHAPTIGAMYEGLTREVLERAVPPGLGLRVVDGFVIDGRGGRSGQIDGMLVQGEGRAVPRTGQYDWHVKDVLAVIEVKKTLTSGNLPDAYDQMAGVMERFRAWYDDALFSFEDFAPSLHTFAQITGQAAPHPDQWDAMDPALGHILWILRAEQMAPLRIILGYGGYKTESGLRGAFLDYLETKQRIAGYGPLNLPNLIIGEGASIVKLCGFPYSAALNADGSWPIMGSSRLNAQQLLLELIWTKISFMRNITELFGDDLEVEVFPALIRARVVEDPEGSGGWGWIYDTNDPKKASLDQVALVEDWAPEEVDAFTFQLLTQCSVSYVDLDHPDTRTDIASAGLTEAQVIETLVGTRLVALDGRRLRLVARELMLLASGDRYLAADNNTGRFTRWLDKNPIA